MTTSGVVKVKRPNLGVDGIITASWGDSRHFTYKISTAKTGSLRGKRVAALLSGPDNASDYKSFAFVSDDAKRLYLWKRFWTTEYENHVKILEGGTDDPPTLWQQAGHCRKCGRLLTDPVSVAIGLGPKCRGER